MRFEMTFLFWKRKKKKKRKLPFLNNLSFFRGEIVANWDTLLFRCEVGIGELLGISGRRVRKKKIKIYEAM